MKKRKHGIIVRHSKKKISNTLTLKNLNKRLHSTVDRISEFYIFRLLGVFSSFAIILLSINFYLASEDRKASREMLAWNNISNRSQPGQVKAIALNYLNNLDRNLIGLNLSPEDGSPKQYMRDLNLSNATARRLNLSNSDLMYSNFNEADIRYSNLSNTTIKKTLFKNTDIFGVNFSESEIFETDFHASKPMSETYAIPFSPVIIDSKENFIDTTPNPLKFKDSHISNSNFTNMELSGANFEGSTLISVNFNDANLSFANFKNAKISFSNFSGSNLYGADFSGAKFIFNDVEGAYFTAEGFSEEIEKFLSHMSNKNIFSFNSCEDIKLWDNWENPIDLKN